MVNPAKRNSETSGSNDWLDAAKNLTKGPLSHLAVYLANLIEKLGLNAETSETSLEGRVTPSNIQSKDFLGSLNSNECPFIRIYKTNRD